MLLKFQWKCEGPRIARTILKINHRAGNAQSLISKCIKSYHNQDGVVLTESQRTRSMDHSEESRERFGCIQSIDFLQRCQGSDTFNEKEMFFQQMDREKQEADRGK